VPGTVPLGAAIGTFLIELMDEVQDFLDYGWG
jgi:hypothetical protein